MVQSDPVGLGGLSGNVLNLRVLASGDDAIRMTGACGEQCLASCGVVWACLRWGVGLWNANDGMD